MVEEEGLKPSVTACHPHGRSFFPTDRCVHFETLSRLCSIGDVENDMFGSASSLQRRRSQTAADLRSRRRIYFGGVPQEKKEGLEFLAITQCPCIHFQLE